MKVNLAFKSKKTLDLLVNLEQMCFYKDAWNKSNLAGLLENDFKSIFFLQNNNTISGYIIIQNIYGEGEIERIGIIPLERKKGLGSVLINESFQILELTDCMLEVDEENISAINLYKKNGFKAVAVRKTYYKNGHNAIIMKWKKGVDAVE